MRVCFYLIAVFNFSFLLPNGTRLLLFEMFSGCWWMRGNGWLAAPKTTRSVSLDWGMKLAYLRLKPAVSFHWLLSVFYSILLLSFPLAVHANGAKLDGQCKDCRELVKMFIDEFKVSLSSVCSALAIQLFWKKLPVLKKDAYLWPLSEVCRDCSYCPRLIMKWWRFVWLGDR